MGPGDVLAAGHALGAFGVGGGGRPGRPRVRGENDGLRLGEVLRDSGENGTGGADGSTGDRPSIDASGLPGFFPNGPGTDRERFGIGLI